MKVKVVNKPFRSKQIGEEFELPDKMAQAMLALKRVEKVSLVAEEPVPAAEPVRQKRQYRRRDMKAEG